MVDRPLRIVMPALTYVPGAMGGSETYAKALVSGLQERSDVELTILTTASAAGALGAASEHIVRSVRGGASTADRLASMTRGLFADKVARGLMHQAHVIHYPFTVPVPAFRQRTAWVETLLDVQHRDLPDMFSPLERRYRSVAYDAAARCAPRVITISEFCRNRIREAVRVPETRIDVAHLGVDTSRFVPSWQRREPFVLYPATAWPHKNHARLIEAIAILREKEPSLRLVLTGGGRSALGELPAWVEHRGHVSSDEIVALYQKAACLAFPSLYEGFGLPPLEAMASGCPVAASSGGALPEICGDAAEFFDPRDVPGMAAAIRRAMAASAALRRHALDRVQRFTWSACVDSHVDSYRRASRM